LIHLNTLPQYNEKELLLQVAKGSEAAFTQLFLHWHQLLAGYILRITESTELTEEIVQDVFMKIWMVRETLTEIQNFKHFLLIVSRNRAFDEMKKILKEKRLKQAWGKENKSEWYIANNLAESSRLSLIDQAINSLPPRRKEVYLLSRHERLTYKEIADRLRISRESVKTHLKLASSSISNFICTHLKNFTILAACLLKNF
jgi:RNA polymerase sigma-70 factor (ECF subfamily)